MLDILRRIVQDINATRDLSEALNLIVAEVKAAMAETPGESSTSSPGPSASTPAP